jgi:hypothetical protein
MSKEFVIYPGFLGAESVRAADGFGITVFCGGRRR